MREQPRTDAPRPRGGAIGRFLLVGGATVLLAHIVGLGSGTASQMLLARLLTPEHLAAYFLTLSVVEVASHLAHIGLPRPLTRFVAQACARDRRDEARGVLGAAFPVVIGCSLAVAVLYASAVGEWLALDLFHSETMASGTAIAAIWLVLHGLSEALAGALRGFRRVGVAAWVAGTLTRVVLAGVLLAVFLASGRTEFLPVLAIAAGASVVGPLVALAVLGAEVKGSSSQGADLGRLVATGLPLLVTGMVHMGYGRADLWTVGALFQQDQVAVYGAVKRLIMLISLPLVILNLVVPPIVAELHERRDLERLQRALRGAATLAGLPAIAILVAFAAWSEAVLGIAFGDFFRQGAAILTLLSIERLVFVWVGPCGMVLAMTGHERRLMHITLVSGVLTVTSIAAGAWLYGFLGVAAGFVLGSSGQQLATWYAVRRLVGLRTDMDLLHVRPAVEAMRRAFNR